MKIRPHHKNLDKHTDFVRDVLVVSNDSYSLVVTAGLDRKVLIWDLSTLNYRATRTGSTAGIECLAFDGKSTLYAGGYDHRIIVWDLDAQIDMPIFFLEGHNKPICKIIARDCDRCVSLDTGGEFRLWDTSKSSTADNEARVIDQLVCNEDRARTLEIIK